ncbi:CBO0543 family protein [Radiobacillus sp. PE A8.2]|uniref:CBO0543 family protein n=1 Tax=Radiobacillus sp. PE A8.2 TaxID=3380349 RepID=UPI0038901351
MIHTNLTNIQEAQKTVSSLRWEHWRSEVVFSPQWLFMIVSLTILIILWVRIVDKTRLKNILLFGTISLLIVTVLDTLGGELQLWEYPYMVLPWGPRIICIDMMISIIFMVIYQYARQWINFIISAIVIAVCFAFILEPIAIKMQIYKPYEWKSFYSLPIYIFLMIMIRLIVDKVLKIESTR